jgi:hypothetical protein
MVAIFLTVSAAARAQFTTPSTTPPPSAPDTMSTVGEDLMRNTYFAVGLNVGLLSGAGLAGRVSFPGGFSAQAAFFIVSVPGDDYGTHFNIGGEAQYAFARTNSGRLYSVLGLGYYSTSRSDSARSGQEAIANPFRIGVGLGYEWFTTRNFVISTALAVTLFTATGDFVPVPEIGFFYYFR